jgi:uncharacterized protein YxeA
MKKVIAVVTTLFFLMVPTFLLAEGMDGGQPTGQDSSVKAEKMDKKASKTKRRQRKSPRNLNIPRRRGRNQQHRMNR